MVQNTVHNFNVGTVIYRKKNYILYCNILKEGKTEYVM